MAILDIVQDGDLVLAKKCTRVTTFDAKLRKLVDDMFETMYYANGVGLAANQIGLPLRLIVIDVPPDAEDRQRGFKIAMANPEIVRLEGEETTPEGCLSVKGWVGDVQRGYRVEVKGLALMPNGQWKEQKVKAHGFLARAFQHECDHLNGVLYTSRVTDITTLHKIERSEEEVEQLRQQLSELRESANAGAAKDTGALMASLRVMSFNIRGANYPDGVNAWPARAALNVATIQQYGPDLIGLQEVQADNLTYYRQHLPAYQFAPGPQYNNTEPYDYVALAWRPERLQLLHAGGFWLSPQPAHYSGPAWGAVQVRSANWARFELVQGGQQFVHLNTHLDYISEQAQVEGTKLILSQLAGVRGGLPALVTGDFNCNPDSEPHALFLAAGYQDSYITLGNRDDLADPTSYTTHYFLGDGYRPQDFHGSGRIDWLLTRGALTPTSYAVARDAQPPAYPSDHYPVLVEFSLG